MDIYFENLILIYNKIHEALAIENPIQSYEKCMSDGKYKAPIRHW